MTDHVAIEVPDFKSGFAFSSWVRTLDEKQIQTWTTDDWLAMYEKLSYYTDNNPDYDKYFRQGYVEEQGKDGQKFLDEASDYDIRRTRRKFFVSREENVSAFVKLYHNYRFEPEQHKAIIALGIDCGKDLATNSYIDAAAISAIRDDMGKQPKEQVEDLLRTAKAIDNTVFRQTNLHLLQHGEKIVDTAGKEVPLYEGWEEFASSIFIDENYDRGSGTTSGGDVDYSLITLGLPDNDNFLESSFHEAAHAHLQNRTVYQKQLVWLGAPLAIKYGEKLDVKFNKMLAYNDDFYFSSNSISPYMMLMREFNPRMNNKEEKKHSRRAYYTYKRQPIERFSWLFSQTAEKAFRRAKKQVSERNAIALVRHLRHRVGLPETANYEDGTILLKYHSPFYKPEEMFARISSYFNNADEKMLSKLNIRRQGDDVLLNVPTDYSFREFINKNFYNKSLLSHVRHQAAKKADKILHKISGGKIQTKLVDVELPHILKVVEDDFSLAMENFDRDVHKIRHKQNMGQKKIKDTLKRVIFGRSGRQE